MRHLMWATLIAAAMAPPLPLSAIHSLQRYEPVCRMANETTISTDFSTSDGATSSDEALDQLFDTPLFEDVPPAADVSIMDTSDDARLIGVQGDSGQVTTLIELAEDTGGTWAAEVVTECLTGAFSSDPEGSPTAQATDWYPALWPTDADVDYKLDSAIPAQWRGAVKAGVSNFSNQAGGNGPDFNATGTSSNLNDLDACNNENNKVYVATNLQSDFHALGLTGRCIVNHGGTPAITKFQITFEAYPDGSNWYVGEGDPGNHWDLESIVTHEAGHATGFYGHFTLADQPAACAIPRTSSTATMCKGNSDIKGTRWLRTNEEKDAQAITAAY